MGMNAVYEGAKDCPEAIPLFPLGGALLLPRGQMPLNIFEPRYLAMIDDALKGERVIGIIQPEPETGRQPEIPPLLKVGCLGRITQFSETGDGRYIITLTGISRFRLLDELAVTTPYRQGRVGYDSFTADFAARTGEDEVDRKGLLKALRDFAKVNALSMMCPFGPREKQALLEAPTLKDRAEVLVAITEIELARGGGDPDTTLQ